MSDATVESAWTVLFARLFLHGERVRIERKETYPIRGWLPKTSELSLLCLVETKKRRRRRTTVCTVRGAHATVFSGNEGGTRKGGRSKWFQSRVTWSVPSSLRVLVVDRCRPPTPIPKPMNPFYFFLICLVSLVLMNKKTTTSDSRAAHTLNSNKTKLAVYFWIVVIALMMNVLSEDCTALQFNLRRR